ncbi:hypothetical protein [Celeribacter sp.]|uniref:hypothetical protein n=1 Tax=Celeribacter sp. TaxID=1890673 RepID=UPI003A915662
MEQFDQSRRSLFYKGIGSYSENLHAQPDIRRFPVNGGKVRSAVIWAEEMLRDARRPGSVKPRRSDEPIANVRNGP